MGKELFKKAFLCLLVLYCIALILHISIHSDRYQWDFRAHYHAGRLFAAGQNPYNPDILFPKSHARQLYTYPPVTLLFYRLFSLMDYETAFRLFLYFKCTALIGIIYLWGKKFLKKEADAFFYLFCFLAFNSAIYLDMKSGNINMLEQGMLWLGFYFFLKKRVLLFCVFILLGAAFKIIPALFLCLLLLLEDPRRYIYFFISVLVFLTYLLIQYIATPYLFTDFVSNTASIMNERGIVNPSTFALIRDLFQLLVIKAGLAVPYTVQLVLVFLIITAVILVSRRAYIALKFTEVKDKERLILFLACLIYALIHPRLKDYAYMSLLVPTYFIIKKTDYLKAIFIFIIAALPFHHVEPQFNMTFSVLWEYYPLAVTYCVWGVYLYEIFVLTKGGKYGDTTNRFESV